MSRAQSSAPPSQRRRRGKLEPATPGRRTAGTRRAQAACAHPFCRGSVRCLIEEAVAGLSIGLVLVNPHGRLVWLNRAAERVLGLSAAEVMGRPFRQILRDPRLAAFWQEAACRPGNCLGDVSVHWPQALELKLNATQCLDESGAEIGRALLFCDVTTDRSVRIELSQEVAARLMDLAAGAGVPAPAANLTPQEFRVLKLVGSGRGNAAIAATLEVLPSTVRTHLKNIYAKLRLATRSEAVAFAVRNGLT